MMAKTHTSRPFPALLFVAMLSTVMSYFLFWFNIFCVLLAIFSVMSSLGYALSRSNSFGFPSIFFESAHESSSFSPVGRSIAHMLHTTFTWIGGFLNAFNSCKSFFLMLFSASAAASTAGSAAIKAVSAFPFSSIMVLACSSAAACFFCASSFCFVATSVFVFIVSIKALTSFVLASTNFFLSRSSICILSTALAASSSFSKPPSNLFTPLSIFFAFDWSFSRNTVM
mmetsp:Transcript_53278/g.159519  ORF Transcript_53278/g.159519 Transcript_53278/m.159519 type:complete len:227 (+) Transcript_53278:4209-4889(+)